MEHETGGSADGYGERIRNRVVDGDELEIKGIELLAVTFAHFERERLNAVLFEFRFDQREGQLRPDEWDVCLETQEIWHRTNVVFVSVREHDGKHVIKTIPDVGEVGQNQVNTGLSLFGEQHSTVDDEQLTAELVDGHVATDFANPTEGNDAECVASESGWVEQFVRHEFLMWWIGAISVRAWYPQPWAARHRRLRCDPG